MFALLLSLSIAVCLNVAGILYHSLLHVDLPSPGEGALLYESWRSQRFTTYTFNVCIFLQSFGKCLKLEVITLKAIFDFCIVLPFRFSLKHLLFSE